MLFDRASAIAVLWRIAIMVRAISTLLVTAEVAVGVAFLVLSCALAVCMALGASASCSVSSCTSVCALVLLGCFCSWLLARSAIVLWSLSPWLWLWCLLVLSFPVANLVAT